MTFGQNDMTLGQNDMTFGQNDMSESVYEQAIAAFARRAQMLVRPTDTMAHLGREDFAILMPKCDVKTAEQIAHRLRQNLAGVPLHLPLFHRTMSLSIAVGVAGKGSCGRAHEEILRRADRALYLARNKGGDAVIADAA